MTNRRQCQLLFAMAVAALYFGSYYAKPHNKPAAVAKAPKHRAPAPAKVEP